ncbi:MAG: response regulator transcription factor [Bacteroidota bacterium]
MEKFYLRTLILSDDVKYASDVSKVLSLESGVLIVDLIRSDQIDLARKYLSNTDLLLCDLDTIGLDIINELRASDIKTRLLLISDDSDLILDSIQYGISGFVNGRAKFYEILNAVSRIRLGEYTLSTASIVKLLDSSRKANTGDFTKREFEVLSELARSKSYRQIGESLGITSQTVKSHLERIYQKLGVNNRFNAVEKAVEMKYI